MDRSQIQGSSVENAKSSAKDKLWGKIQQQQLQDLRFILSYGNNAPQRN